MAIIPEPAPRSTRVEAPKVNPDPNSLLSRMRRVQMLMLDINRLENEPGVDNRDRIRELQRQVSNLTEDGGPRQDGAEPSGRRNEPQAEILEPPPAYGV